MSAAPAKKGAAKNSRARLYLVTGIILAILAAALILWNSGIFQKNVTAATIGDHKLTAAEMDFYYFSQANQTVNMAYTYTQMGKTSPYNTQLRPEEQYFDAEKKITYAQYFQDEGLKNAQLVFMLTDQARAENFTADEEIQAQIDAAENQLTMYSVRTGYSEEGYLQQLYGKHMTRGLYRDLLRQAALADAYAAHKRESFPTTPEELDAYYQENRSDLDSYTYRACYISAETPAATDSAGTDNAEAAQADTAAAMAEAKTKADALAARLRAGEEMAAAAQEYVSAETAKSYQEDPEAMRASNVLGSELPAPQGDWLKDPARKPGDVTVLESGNSYCVVQMILRDKGEKVYQSAALRRVSVPAEITPAAAEVEGATPATPLPTAEQLSAAKTRAEALLSQWESGAKTAESFSALAEQKAEGAPDLTAETLPEATRSTLSAAASSWVFSTEGLAPGAVTLLESKDASGNVTGYDLWYLEGFGDIRWEYTARQALTSKAYDAWAEEQLVLYPINYLGAPLEDKVAQITTEDPSAAPAEGTTPTEGAAPAEGGAATESGN